MTLETLQTMDTPALERALREKQGWRVSFHPRVWADGEGSNYYHLHSPGQPDTGYYWGPPRLSEAGAWSNAPSFTSDELMGALASEQLKRAILIACLLQEEKK